MKRFFLLILCLLLLGCAVGCGKDTPEPEPTVLPDESYAEQYVLDPVINRFILAFNQQNHYTLAGLVQNGDLSCTAYIDICQLTMRSTEQGLLFSLTGGNTEADHQRMWDVFRSIAQIADPSCTDVQVQSVLDLFASRNETVVRQRVSNYITINTYVPVIQMDTVQVDCRMEFTASNYLPEDE